MPSEQSDQPSSIRNASHPGMIPAKIRESGHLLHIWTFWEAGNSTTKFQIARFTKTTPLQLRLIRTSIKLSIKPITRVHVHILWYGSRMFHKHTRKAVTIIELSTNPKSSDSTYDGTLYGTMRNHHTLKRTSMTRISSQ